MFTQKHDVSKIVCIRPVNEFLTCEWIPRVDTRTQAKPKLSIEKSVVVKLCLTACEQRPSHHRAHFLWTYSQFSDLHQPRRCLERRLQHHHDGWECREEGGTQGIDPQNVGELSSTLSVAECRKHGYSRKHGPEHQTASRAPHAAQTNCSDMNRQAGSARGRLSTGRFTEKRRDWK